MGVPHGSVLGPILWNIFYDQVLTLELPRNCNTIAYADDLVLIVKERKKDLLEYKTEEAIRRIHNWMTENKLKLAPEKTEAINFLEDITM